jgi:hypothetical protein
MKESTVRHDPIVAEIHAIRERLASQYQNDLAAYSLAAEAHCRALGFTFAEGRRSEKIKVQTTNSDRAA